MGERRRLARGGWFGHGASRTDRGWHSESEAVEHFKPKAVED